MKMYVYSELQCTPGGGERKGVLVAGGQLRPQMCSVVWAMSCVVSV